MGCMQSFRNFGNWFRASVDAFNNKNKEFKQLCLWKESNIFERKDVLQYGK